MKNIIDTSKGKINDRYPQALPGANNISWADLQFCKSGGTKSAPKYFTKSDAERLGFNPKYPIGGTLMQGKLFKKHDPLPIKVNYVMNSDIFVIIKTLIFGTNRVGFLLLVGSNQNIKSHVITMKLFTAELGYSIILQAQQEHALDHFLSLAIMP